ncbi:tail terminator [Arthrobacter phage Sporto]|nr:tail terminator [Arthrobacter phage Sporto]
MAPRHQLQTLLESILGTRNVYFQAPPSTGMSYPCIIYKLDYIDTDYAGNRPYSHNTRYLVTIIDRNPDTEFPKKVAELPTAKFSSRFVTEGLNHIAFNLYF